MKSTTRLAWILAAASLTVSVTGLAQHGPGQRPQGQKPGAAQPQQNVDQDRKQDRDQTEQQGQQKAQDQAREMDRDQQSDIYGYQLMTEQERKEYQARLEKAATNQEREQIVAEHHEEMQARAKEKGVNLEEAEESE